MAQARIASHNGNFVIKSNRQPDTYWQVGQWVQGVSNATLYSDENEASMVIALRNIRDATIGKSVGGGFITL
jgi:hypothetical protein